MSGSGVLGCEILQPVSGSVVGPWQGTISGATNGRPGPVEDTGVNQFQPARQRDLSSPVPEVILVLLPNDRKVG